MTPRGRATRRSAARSILCEGFTVMADRSDTTDVTPSSGCVFFDLGVECQKTGPCEVCDLHFVSLEEASKQIIDRGGVPALLDAAENVVIGYEMGLDMNGFIDVLRKPISLLA